MNRAMPNSAVLTTSNVTEGETFGFTQTTFTFAKRANEKLVGPFNPLRNDHAHRCHVTSHKHLRP